jgi:excisionase family DNA binding protein
VDATLVDVSRQFQELTAVVRVLAQRLPTLLTIPEAANLFGVSTKTVRRRIQDREWPHVRVGREVRVGLARVRPEVMATIPMVARP